MMRRMFPVALLSALLVFVPTGFGQHGPSGSYGGGHVGGSIGHIGGGSIGHFGGGSIGHFGGSYGGHFSGPAFNGPGRMPGFPTHSFGAAPRMTFPGPSRGFLPAGSSLAYRDRGSNGGWGDRGWRNPGRPGGGWGRGGQGRGDHGVDRDHGDHHRGFYNGYGYGNGYNYGYPGLYANSWELLPWDLGSDFMGEDDSTDASAQQQSYAQNDTSQPQDNGDRPDYAGPSDGYGPPPPPQEYGPGYGPGADPGGAAEDSPVTPEPRLSVIFKDGHQQTIQNYVLTREALIVLDHAASGRQQRIPLADLNLPATEQAAQQAGLEFSPPS